MSAKPNIILIITDQQRADTISALGAPWMHTPTLDRLVREGAAYTNCFVTSPVCVGSRASLFTGMYPHAGGVFTNFQPWEPNWVRWLADAGYHCASIGKMHINPYDALGGFHQRFVVENKDRPLFLKERDRAFYDEWDKALHARKLVKPSRYTRHTADPEGYREALGAFAWDLDEDMHSDMFVGDHAVWWLEERKSASPLFLQIGFPGPHPPYDPVPRHLARYAATDIPLPRVTEAELAQQPRSQAALRQNMIRDNYDSVAWQERPSAHALLRLRRHYAANVSMIDEKVGQIIDALGRKGYLDNALVIFTSDHADALGDHGHIQKWTMYDCVERVPLVFWSPGRLAPRAASDALVQLMDIAPTILEAADVSVPPNWEARSLLRALSGGEPVARDAVYAELARDHIQTGAEYIVMRRDRDWKLVYYLGEPDGELFDLQSDAGEVRNLWHASEHRELRERLVRELQEWSMRGTLRSRMPARRKPQQPMLI
ncbi:MAG: sulfatase-like hydrolase/transferase [Betaproteobacteria bacterium]|nr:sulfatase-like hydrolase/transferase [Betaproteobacteria bacterium]